MKEFKEKETPQTTEKLNTTRTKKPRTTFEEISRRLRCQMGEQWPHFLNARWLCWWCVCVCVVFCVIILLQMKKMGPHTHTHTHTHTHCSLCLFITLLYLTEQFHHLMLLSSPLPCRHVPTRLILFINTPHFTLEEIWNDTDDGFFVLLESGFC